jgi:hypothetical protein
MKNDGGYWTIECQKHPWKKIVFTRNDDLTMKLCGEGFQGPNDPLPMIRVNTSIGEWTMRLNCDEIGGGWVSIGTDLAREVWEGLINQGWKVR